MEKPFTLPNAVGETLMEIFTPPTEVRKVCSHGLLKGCLKCKIQIQEEANGVRNMLERVATFAKEFKYKVELTEVDPELDVIFSMDIHFSKSKSARPIEVGIYWDGSTYLYVDFQKLTDRRHFQSLVRLKFFLSHLRNLGFHFEEITSEHETEYCSIAQLIEDVVIAEALTKNSK